MRDELENLRKGRVEDVVYKDRTMDEFEDKIFDAYDIRKKNRPHQPRIKK